MAEKSEKYHHGDLKNQLIESAIDLLQEPEAEERLSLRSLAKNAGVSHAAPYRHFQSKEDLLQAVAAYGFSRLASRQKKKGKNLPIQNRCFLQSKAYISFGLENPQLYRLMFARKSLNPDKDLVFSRNRSYSVLTYSMKQLAKNKKKKEYRMNALRVWSMLHGFVSLAIDTDFPETEAKLRNLTIEQLADRLIENLFK